MKQIIYGIIFAVGLAAGVVVAQEAVTLSTPVVKTATACHASIVTLDMDRKIVGVVLAYDNGDTGQKTWDATTTPTGATLLHNMNTGNFSGAVSFVKAVYNRLSLDGICVGSVTGTPQ